MRSHSRIEINRILRGISEELQITDSQHKLAESRYDSVGNWLSESALFIPFKPEIFPQGSFALGTMIKPIVEDDNLDVDLVFQIEGKPASWTQELLKKSIGDRLKENDNYSRMLKRPDKRRCWTVEYARGNSSNGFHMDILPAVASEGYSINLKQFASGTNRNLGLDIRITDKRSDNYNTDSNIHAWPSSNPWGYKIWFFEQIAKHDNINKSMLLEKAITPIPKFDKKHEIQQIIQILKRHRDIMFEGDEDKPISIIITTLAVSAYSNSGSIYSNILNVLKSMHNYIEKRVNPTTLAKYSFIANPANRNENFADKWIENVQKENNFYEWLEKAKADFGSLNEYSGQVQYNLLSRMLGEKPTRLSFEAAGYNDAINESTNFYNQNLQPILNIDHREIPKWEKEIQGHVTITASYNTSTSKLKVALIQGVPIPKNCDIFFRASTNISKGYEVHWQVVNTGVDAKKSRALRGNIFKAKSAGSAGLSHKESSLYTGNHYVFCYIVKDRIVVAISDPFFVSIL